MINLKNNLLLKLNLVILIILLGVLIYISLIKNPLSRTPSYYVLYLQTGELYFGKLTQTLNSYILTNVYLLQKDSSGNFGLQKFNQAVYEPEDKMIIKKDKVIWITKLSATSPLIPYLENKQPTNTIPSNSVPTPPAPPSLNQENNHSTSSSNSGPSTK